MKVLMLLLIACASVAHSDESESVKDVFRAGSEAWNRGDVDGYLDTYATEGPVRWVSGARMVSGRNAIANAFRSRFPSPEAMGVLTTKNLQVEILTASDALVFGEWHQQLGAAMSSGVFTVHLRRFAGGWAIVSDHSSALD